MCDPRQLMYFFSPNNISHRFYSSWTFMLCSTYEDFYFSFFCDGLFMFVQMILGYDKKNQKNLCASFIDESLSHSPCKPPRNPISEESVLRTRSVKGNVQLVVSHCIWTMSYRSLVTGWDVKWTSLTVISQNIRLSPTMTARAPKVGLLTQRIPANHPRGQVGAAGRYPGATASSAQT